MPVFYKVLSPSNNHECYLMGTFHLMVDEFQPLLKKAEELMSSCSHYYGEMDLTQVDPHILLKIQQDLPKPEKKLLKILTQKESYFRKKGLKFPAYPEQSPIFNLYSELTTTMWTRNISDGSIDEALLKYALAKGLTISGLETFEDQIAIMQSINYKELEKQIISMLKHPRKFSKKMDFMLDIYLKGKMNKLSNEAIQTTASNKKMMVKNRNKIFTEKIEEIIERQENCLISFGAGHLGGKNGVVAGLRKRGYKVKGMYNKLLKQ